VSPGAIVEFDRVSFAYDRGQPVVEDATFTVGARETVCLIGPNGGGKTTILKLLLGLLEPTSGTVRVFDEAPAKSRLRIGYMPQSLQFDRRFPVSVLDIALMGRLDRRPAGPFRRHDRQAALAALAEVGLSGLAGRQFCDLSGGQRQRVLIARALACEPELLVLDEPTANVDQAVEAQLYETLTRLGQRMAVLMVSHDLGAVSTVAGSVLCVNRDVHRHPTSELTGETIGRLYGTPMRAVHHRHGDCHDHHTPAPAP
jgi:zinc transport system ATP-binding protein